jgi:hypothetical protein
MSTNYQHWNWSPEREAKLKKVLRYIGMMMAVHDQVSALEIIEKYALERHSEPENLCQKKTEEQE